MTEIVRVLASGDLDVYDVPGCELKEALYHLSCDLAAGIIKKVTLTDLDAQERDLLEAQLQP